jgi:hypothetical protein
MIGSKIEIYAIILVVLMSCGIGAYFKGRHDGYLEEEGKASAALIAANTKVDQLNAQLTKLTDASSQQLAAQIKSDADQLATALANVKPVIVRVPASGVQNGGATGTPGTPGGQQPANGDLPASFDIASAELVFAAKYQQCRDSLNVMKYFYADLRKKVNGP